jgi:hypothetical protein
MVPYNSPRSVSVGIVLHRNDGRTPDYVCKDRRRKPQGPWHLRRQFALHCIDLALSEKTAIGRVGFQN